MQDTSGGMELFGENVVAQNVLPVMQVQFTRSARMTWQELFAGFDTMRAITYSSGLRFMDNVLSTFSDVEILLGFEDVIQPNIESIIASQDCTVEALRELYKKDAPNITRLIDNDGIRFFVAQAQISHEKLYLLSDSKSGKTRALFGSANFSSTAFSGRQREIISFMDDDESGYDYLLKQFNDFKRECSAEVKHRLITSASEIDIAHLPIAETVKVQKLLVVENNPIEQSAATSYVTAVNKEAANIRKLLPSEMRKRTVHISPEHITKLSRTIKDTQRVESMAHEERHDFVYDITQKTAMLGGKMLDLNPTNEDVSSDAKMLIQYMEDFSAFHGNITALQTEYYKLLVWFFCCPFMPYVRHVACGVDKNVNVYPTVAILYGTSSAGKTKFVELLYKAAFGMSTAGAKNFEFTPKNIMAERMARKGVPIFKDDIVQTSFTQNVLPMIKTDDFGIREGLDNYACMIMTSNIESMPQEVAKRTVLCNVNAGLDIKDTLNESDDARIRRHIGTALYRKYLSAFMEELPRLIDTVCDEDATSPADIFALSSQVLHGILSGATDEPLPEYITEVSLMDYFDDNLVSAAMKDKVRKMWNNAPEVFDIRPRKNLLRIRFDTDGATKWDAKKIKDMCPKRLDAMLVNGTLTMQLDEARTFFGVEFRQRWFSKTR